MVCSRCVMDGATAGITFDAAGQCNYCSEFLARWDRLSLPGRRDQSAALAEFVGQVKSAGQRRTYDCVVGVSGGVDSSWVLVNAVRMGLRPLAVHMDNGWNSELAQNNIANLVRGIGGDEVRVAGEPRIDACDAQVAAQEAWRTSAHALAARGR